MGLTGPTVLLVTGTGTEVGKTWVAAGLARTLRARGRVVAARKPAQSFEPGDDDAGVTDAHVLGAATGEAPSTVCPPARWYPVPMAPPMAAAALGRPPFSITDLAAELAAGIPAPPPDLVLVETAGGVRSPLAGDGDTVTLAGLLHPDHAVVVADPGLGTINTVRLTVDALAGARTPAPIVVLNRFDAADRLHRANADWLRDTAGMCCVTSVDELAEAVDGTRTRPLQW